MKITNLSQFGCRFPLMVSRGLMENVEEVTTNLDVVSYGKVIKEKSNNIERDLMESDMIFRSNDEHFKLPNIDRILTNNNLWGKVVYYDFKDSHVTETNRLNTCLAYTKRNWVNGRNRGTIPDRSQMFPLDFSYMYEYSYPDKTKIEKDIDVVYAFHDNPLIGARRYNVLQELKKSGIKNLKIGVIKFCGTVGRKAITNPIEGSSFLEYLHLLRRAKIVFTAYPENWDGDIRFWEAMSSGSLVFSDISYTPRLNPIKHGEHCFYFNAQDRTSINNAIEVAKEYLHKKERIEIGQSGKEFVEKYHNAQKRIEELLTWINNGKSPKFPLIPNIEHL